MADAEGQKVTSLAEQWSLPKEEPTHIVAAVENVNDENPVAANPDSLLVEKTDEVPAAGDNADAAEDNTAAVEDKTAPAEENSRTPELEESEEEEATEEEKPELKLETAPADFRFPTTNQSRHCFTRYIEYHRCITAKGDDAPECTKFAKYYRALCPGEWIERWNEQRENGTFPGPL